MSSYNFSNAEIVLKAFSLRHLDNLKSEILDASVFSAGRVIFPLWEEGSCLMKEGRDVGGVAVAVAVAVARGGGTLLYGLYRYVRPQKVGFFSLFAHK